MSETMQAHLIDRLDATRDWSHRWRWLRRLIVAVVILWLFGPFIYSRLTAVPGADEESYQLDWDALLAFPPPQLDRTKELLAALDRLPELPPVSAPTTAPAGKRWVAFQDGKPATATGISSPGRLKVYEALEGEWSPSTRFGLQHIVEYPRNDQVQDVLDSVIELDGAPFCLPEVGGSNNRLAETYDLVSLLIVRARYYMAEERDFESAIRDIQTALHIAAELENDRPLHRLMAGMTCRRMASQEAMYWSQEYHLTKAQALDLLGRIGPLGFDVSAAFRLALQTNTYISIYNADRLYAKLEHGNGWYILHRHNPENLGDRLLQTLNLLSGLFEDRQTALAKMSAYSVGLAGLSSMPYPQAARAMERIQEQGQIFSPTTGMLSYFKLDVLRLYTIFLRQEARRRGAIVAIALEAYESDNGRFPERLSMLAPEYLSSIPTDPFSGKPFCYQLDAERGYVLYSVHTNGTDDGGKTEGQSRSTYYWKDLILNKPRPEPSYEWRLMPIDTATEQSDDEQSE